VRDESDEVVVLDYDADLSHGVLIAVLMRLGGSVVMAAEDFAPDAMGRADGTLYCLALQPLPDGQVRLSVVPTITDSPGG
jgi:hypothetical protein